MLQLVNDTVECRHRRPVPLWPCWANILVLVGWRAQVIEVDRQQSLTTTMATTMVTKIVVATFGWQYANDIQFATVHTNRCSHIDYNLQPWSVDSQENY